MSAAVSGNGNQSNQQHRNERPGSAVSPGTPTLCNSQKSMIPKYRSLSQPPSAMLLDDGKLIESKAEKLAESDKLIDDSMAQAEEFKDCLDSVKLDMESSSATALDDIKISTSINEDILYILPLETKTRPDKNPTPASLSLPNSSSVGGAATKRSSMSRKNSSSGIPVSVSAGKAGGKSPSTPKPITPKSRNNLSSSFTRKPISSSSTHATESPRRNLSPMNANKRNQELFATKKKRFELLKREIQDKQKPMIEMFTSLQKLKKKLDDSGLPVLLEPMRVLDFSNAKEPKPKPPSDVTGAGEQLVKLNITEDAVEQIKKTIAAIQNTSSQLCKELLTGQQDLLKGIIKLCNDNTTKEDLVQELLNRKAENENLENSVKVAIREQEKEIEDMVARWSQLAQKTETVNEDAYKEKISKLEKELKDTTAELNNNQQQYQDINAQQLEFLGEENEKLKQKIATLEKQVEHERKKAQADSERFKTAESSVRSFKVKLKEIDSNKQQHENKVSQLNSDLRAAQNKIKIMERNYEKEIAELNKSRNLDKIVIERLNKDKSTFETRIRVANQQMETFREESGRREKELRAETFKCQKEMDIQDSYVAQLKTEIEKLKAELVEVQTYAKQTSDVIKNRRDGKGPQTEKECELQIEVVAQRAAIKALQERIEANSKEKLRFIETIEKINGHPDQIQQDVVKSLVRREEDITHLHQIIKKKDAEILNRKIEIQNLQAKLDNLSAHVEAMQIEGGGNDLKNMLKEGKTKLEHALMKSLENEHKIIKYEHELSQKAQAIANLENMLKVRDGILSVMKTKKVELDMENRSLTKYSEEIRNCVLETKEELKVKNDTITQLQSALDAKTREWQKNEQRVEELEEKLASTNEKRYKLQDTVSLMERELQATKADVQTRTRNKFLRRKGRGASEN